ncbi:type II toxin-antitoxin system RelB/DinJ family antitoxin [Campylobacter geochelonis]|uniref:Addiction module antitoxin n=1 Tax=Campylobacter geochelonis TaxID=1780362 RepID=A0A128EIB9_9BACT|nr:type II toxin-antitoxin system RelB/DinJ family antitoxin [Campylobacter geochelonis]QKF70753.1 toxin-antitoxin system, antitoxin component, RelB family [Campylobacter geochelonis]CZE47295.1 addiction module antitoxin [Campylobacter geochelonis]CZE48600.1 addiction module antitoxin [Campylobacter geochelonis]CZE50522.1 addiction module antitoxin [Campylobacter geochelonis]
MTTLIQTRVDIELKKEAEALFKDLGLDTTTAIRIFLKQAVIRQGIPFEVSTDGFYSECNQKILAKSIDELNKGKIIKSEPLS